MERSSRMGLGRDLSESQLFDMPEHHAGLWTEDRTGGRRPVYLMTERKVCAAYQHHLLVRSTADNHGTKRGGPESTGPAYAPERSGDGRDTMNTNHVDGITCQAKSLERLREEHGSSNMPGVGHRNMGTIAASSQRKDVGALYCGGMGTDVTAVKPGDPVESGCHRISRRIRYDVKDGRVCPTKTKGMYMNLRCSIKQSDASYRDQLSSGPVAGQISRMWMYLPKGEPALQRTERHWADFPSGLDKNLSTSASVSTPAGRRQISMWRPQRYFHVGTGFASFHRHSAQHGHTLCLPINVGEGWIIPRPRLVTFDSRSCSTWSSVTPAFADSSQMRQREGHGMVVMVVWSTSPNFPRNE
ncbi:hypothetical protein SODALDRAFT_375079 [Sodiomyces alkalinus F11]|uniref:Uncharacterized protein n=1 Tax=Sodiomyces alkalinus (strain CBS 110278 / VKM F-3762 / F11) TaxID=1314773 RepID=A0A3N2Q7R5_SODAK|nr:hypothetical protein SODALDRAFT_375079 [Sodiomyces alkalinus F11]ROT42821.1 hypothetical protein SODALDRAFT_375079 [Sodiomyces alkalinus F11]